MADEIKELQAQVTLTRGDNGIFDVKKEGELIFSKDETGRFPEPEEIKKLLSN